MKEIRERYERDTRETERENEKDKKKEMSTDHFTISWKSNYQTI